MHPAATFFSNAKPCNCATCAPHPVNLIPWNGRCTSTQLASLTQILIGCTVAVAVLDSVEAPSMDGDPSKFLAREDKGVSCDALP